MKKEITNEGIIRVNDLSFLDFCRELRGYNIFDRKTGRKIYKYTLFWNGISPTHVCTKFELRIIRHDNN